MSVEMWKSVASTWIDLSNQINEDDWDKPTGCEVWCIRDLFAHARETAVGAGNAIGASINDDHDWEGIKNEMAVAMSDPSNLEGVSDAHGGMPKQGVANIAIGDLLLHTWDLAEALGAKVDLPDDAIDATLSGLKLMPEDTLRRKGMFGPALEVSEDASAQERLLAFTGRQPKQ